jgi:DNA-directed RNA polymerase specialized sigma24 family protein
MSLVRSDDSPFPNTSWSLVARAAHAKTSERRRALASLLAEYLPAMRVYLVRRRGLSDDRADDLLQAFVVSKILEQHLIRRADQARGKFRAFLLAALDHYLIDQVRRESAAKRSAQRASDVQELPEAQHPSQEDANLFDVEWARQAVDLAVKRMHRECEARGRTDVWSVFEGRVLAAAFGTATPLSYEQLVRQFNLSTSEQAANLLVTAKRMFARNLHEVVGEYAEDDLDAREEIRRLKSILARGGAG